MDREIIYLGAILAASGLSYWLGYSCRACQRVKRLQPKPRRLEPMEDY